MNLCDKLIIPAQVMARVVGNETVILDLANGTYYGLDLVGARVWQLISENNSLLQICDEMVLEFETTHEVLQHDVLTLAQALLERKLVGVSD